MKATLFATLAATLLTATTALAAPTPYDHDRNDRDRYEQGPGRRLSPQEAARLEAQRRHDNRRDDHFDRNQNYGFERGHQATRDERYRWEQAHNYGYAQGHRVSPQERARWEAQYRR